MTQKTKCWRDDAFSHWCPIVAVPALNEESRLERLLDALDRQYLLPGERLPVLLLINNTTDRSIQVAEACARRLRQVDLSICIRNFVPPSANVGMARKAAMDLALARAPSGAATLLMTTDADAQPDAGWVSASRRAVTAGADLVTGQIVADPREEALLGIEFLKRSRAFETYCHIRTRLGALLDPVAYDPWPHHHFEMAGSIAVRSNVYLAVGGFEPVAYREDLAFVSKVKAAGYRVRHSMEARVTVSARTSGRAPQGMSQSFARWKAEAERGEPLLVEHPQKTLARFALRQQLRCADRGRLQARLKGAGLAHVVLPEALPIARSLSIELLAQDDPDTCELPVEVAVTEFHKVMHHLAPDNSTAELSRAG